MHDDGPGHDDRSARLPGEAPAAPSRPASIGQRVTLVDAFKTVGCLAIILHHLAFYGPMSDVVRQAWPPLSRWIVDGLFDYGRAAVYGFLVVGGYLAGQAYLPGRRAERLPRASIATVAMLRYARLAPVAWMAIAAALASAAIARSLFVHDDTPAPAGVWQVAAHLLFLQDLVGVPGLSAGYWYVAVDLQLFVLLAVLLRWLDHRGLPLHQAALGPGQRLPIGQLILAAIAILGWAVFDHIDALDVTALYFVGAYLLGVLAAAYAPSQPLTSSSLRIPSSEPGPDRNAGATAHRAVALLPLLAVAGTAMVAAPRVRTALAVVLALCLALRPSPGFLRGRLWQVGSELSYAAFLIHYPICLLVNAVFTRWGGADPVVNLVGIGVAVILSYAAAIPVDRAARALRLPDRIQARRRTRRPDV